VAQQQALVEKKTISAPFSGRLGISTVNPGQYLNPGDKIVTLQELDPLYIDFYLPQQELARAAVGQTVMIATDSFPGRVFKGRITTINPKVDQETRNVQAEALITNTGRLLLPGMYATVEVQAGAVQRYITVPQTAVTYNPYGNTVFVVKEQGAGQDGKPQLTAQQVFVTIGPTRGDQVAILTGVQDGDTAVTSGQLKLKNGSAVIINSKVLPSNEEKPQPEDE
jgi:membrane fusion protein (multidrug efflux system)